MKIENKTVVAATASNSVVTLYFNDGETMRLPADDAFTQRVIDKVTPALAAGKTITLNMEDHVLNIYTEMEKKTNGLVKFFRVAKKALLGIDTPTEQQIESLALPMENYNMASTDETIVAVIQKAPTNVEDSQSLASGEAQTASREPEATSGTGNEAESSTGDAAVSPAAEANVVPDTSVAHEAPEAKPAATVLVGAEALKNQINHFQKQDNPVGFNAFMQRLATVIKTRGHTAKELLDFLSKADLPIADDGCIVAYKRLNKHHDGGYVDSHSGRVKQRVGSRVFMRTEMVDPDRRNECSNGLHIGRRDYMRSFSGNAIVIVKIAPEDVVAVPQDYNGSKMRCCGYHIVAEVPKEGFNHLERNDPMTKDSKAAQMLTKVIRGLHDPVDQLVEIRGHKGTDLVITELKEPTPEEPVALVQETVTQELPVPLEGTQAIEELKDDGREKIDPSLNSPKAIKEKAAKAKAAPKKPAEVIKAEATGDPRKVKKAKRKAAAKAPEPVKVAAPVIAQEGDMTEYQLLAKKRWPEVKAGTLSKVKLAQECKTSTRSLDRWSEKYNF